MATRASSKARTRCRPTRVKGKPGPKTVPVKRHKRSKPQPLKKKC